MFGDLIKNIKIRVIGSPYSYLIRKLVKEIVSASILVFYEHFRRSTANCFLTEACEWIVKKSVGFLF
jgi:hypothetical protein